MDNIEMNAAARGMTVSEYLIEMRECQMAEQRMARKKKVNPKSLTPREKATIQRDNGVEDALKWLDTIYNEELEPPVVVKEGWGGWTAEAIQQAFRG